MGYTICYSFQGNQRVLECPEDDLCAHDAVYYALRHSGVELDGIVSGWQGCYQSMVDKAQQSGVSNVLWHRSIARPTYDRW